LQVASDGYVISNSVNFEYKSQPKVETKVEGSSNDVMYKFSLLSRLETIDEKLQIKIEPTDLVSKLQVHDIFKRLTTNFIHQPEDSVLFSQPNFEDRLVNYCQTLISKTWRSMTPGTWSSGHKGMTLLHLASALGYSRLVCAMLKWRAENSSIILEAEVDALSQDIDGFTPLVCEATETWCRSF
jgi:calmodulin-binding transcription activator